MSFLNVNQISTAAGTPSFTTVANGINVGGGILGAGDASTMKNRLINGAMVISQYNGTSSVTPTNAQYVLDRWNFNLTQASKFTVQQNAGSVTPPVGFPNYLGITSSSAYSVGSGDIFALRQAIEGYNFADLGFGTASAKTVTVSAWVYSSLTGIFGGSLANYADTRSYPFTYSIPVANTWTQISVTIAGDTSGTWVGNTNAGAAFVFFGLGGGSSYSGTAGSWASADYRTATGATSVVGTSGATFYITGVQLEVGSSATGFEYRQYGTELNLCLRYYTQWTATTSAAFVSTPYNNTTNNFWMQFQHPIPLRATPTVVVSNWQNGSPSSSYPGAFITSFQFTNGTYYFNANSLYTASAEL